MPHSASSSPASSWALTPAEAARWIFPALPPEAVNQYVDFRHEFACADAAADAELWISADTDFVVWLNGHLLGFGQYANYPDGKTYECLALRPALQAGRNSLTITVFYNGRTSSVYLRGEPGLLFAVRQGRAVLAASGTATYCRPNSCYHHGPIAIVSHQLAYAFGYDARGDDGYTGAAYQPGSAWRAITAAEATLPPARRMLLPRPVPRLVDGGSTPATLLAGGLFRLDVAQAAQTAGAMAQGQTLAGLALSAGAPISPAWQMQHAELLPGNGSLATPLPVGRALTDLPGGLVVAAPSLPEHGGIYLIFDLGSEEVGQVELDLDADSGTIVDVGYGEHLADGHVRSFVGGRHFAGRYVCRAGRQQFCHRFLRWAGRYLQVHVHAPAFTLHRLGLRRTQYPVTQRGQLHTGAPIHDRLLEVGQYTLRLCMHEHYEDSPWREQALYANDARTQALCGYYLFGEAAMPAASFALLGQGRRDDGWLELCAPARPGVTIPSFTFVWMLAVRDHFLYTGDDRLARAFLPQLRAMLAAFLAQRRDGLLPLSQAPGIWHFYDWSAGMEGYAAELFARGLSADAPLNCFFILALEAVQQILDWCGEPGGVELASAATELRAAVAAQFWAPAEDAWRTHTQASGWAELTQALAVLAGVGDAAMRARALARLARPDSGLAAPGLSQSYYVFEALMTDPARYGAGVLARIEAVWGRMLAAGATTFWETSVGERDFQGAGSLCHGWSAVPVYVLYHDVLGVRPLTPGFRTFAATPLAGRAGPLVGSVPVPGGQLEVVRRQQEPGSWQVTVQAPPGCHWQRASATG